MELIGGLLAGLVTMALLAGVGLAAIIALAVMAVLYFLTELDFKKVFLISAGVGLLGPVMLGLAISSALADGSIQRDLRDQVGSYVQLPDDQGEGWREALGELQELSNERENGTMSDEEAERRVEQILGGLDDMQITIDVDGDGVVIGDSSPGVPLEVAEGVEAPASSD
ncbi:MAG: hypothetical protein AAGI28_04445 [Pseudomonadota bacterium]